MQLIEEKKKVEEYVLDKELFIREAKMHVHDGQYQRKKKEFAEAMGNYMLEGNAIEIIDGDIDTLDKDSLTDIMQWIEAQKQ